MPGRVWAKRTPERSMQERRTAIGLKIPFELVNRRLFPALVLTLAVVMPLAAHEMGIMQVEGTFRKNGMYVVDILVDLEHLPARTGVSDIAGAARIVFDGIPARPAKIEIVRNVD